MKSQAHIKEPHKLRSIESAAKCNQRRLLSFLEESESGFTLIEMLVVVIIIAVLSAIAAPGWLAFTNRQRVSKVNDAVFSALQQAQSQAKLKKQSYSASFRIDTTSNPNGALQAAVYQAASGVPSSTSNGWQPLGQNLAIDAGQVALGTNLVGENNSNTSLTRVSSSNTWPITFDYTGALSPAPGSGSGNSQNGLIIAVTTQNNSSTPFNGTKRCVVVKTLLGAMQVAQDDKCNP